MRMTGLAGASPATTIDGQRPSQRRIVVATRSLGETSTLAWQESLGDSQPCPLLAWGRSGLVLVFTGFNSGGSGLSLTAANGNAPGTTGLAHRDGHGKDTVLVPG